MAQEIVPVIKTYACPPHLAPKHPKKRSGLSRFITQSPLIRATRHLITPPPSPVLLDPKSAVPPKPLRMPEENKQILQFCTVCASNQNRSMAAHRVLKDAGYNVQSFGTGSNVRLPGPSMDKPNVYEFGTPYDDMFKDLQGQNSRLYASNGVLNMLDRNRHIKDHPEQWAEHHEVFDVVFTCQERCFDSVCIDLLHRGAKLSRPVHVINVEIEDNHVEAAKGAQAILDLANLICNSTDPDTEMVDNLNRWQKSHQEFQSTYQLCYF